MFAIYGIYYKLQHGNQDFPEIGLTVNWWLGWWFLEYL